MKKNWGIIVVVLIIIIGLVGYLGRHKIKTLMGVSPTQAPVQPSKPSPTSSAVIPSDNIYTTKTSTTKGNYLADFQGVTLYIFDKDTAGVSTCYNGCAKAWPPYTSGATAQSTFPPHITVITRTDGTKQFAWDQKPLYYYATDTKAGDISGDGVGGVWHIIRP